MTRCAINRHAMHASNVQATTKNETQSFQKDWKRTYGVEAALFAAIRSRV